jgi:hypothetical protein
MGCWDIFCFLCGNTCHESYKNIKDDFLNSIEFYEKTIINSKNKKYNYFRNYFTPIYKKYILDPKLFLYKISIINKKTKWLNKCTFLSADNQIIHNCKQSGCNIEFNNNKKNEYFHETEYDSNMYGVFVHYDCWLFIKNTYHIQLQYSYLPIINNSITDKKLFKFIDYGIIEKYWLQDFDFIKLVSEDNDELYNSPLKSILVAKNIKKVYTQLKIKNELTRKSPIVSATFYKNGTCKIGLNGNIWFIKGGKWIELKDTSTFLISSSKLNIIKYIKFIGDVNNNPLFIINMSTNKKKNDIKVISTHDYLLNKKLIK